MRVSLLMLAQQHGQPVLVVNYAFPRVLDAVIKYIETSQLPPAESQPGEHVTASRLQHYADVYILANGLQIHSLKSSALEKWSETTESCLFGAFPVKALNNLVQHTYSKTTQNDADIRVAALRLATSYHQTYTNMAFAVSTDPQVSQKCTPDLYKQLFCYQREFPELDNFLRTKDPVAWQLAKMYEEELQKLNHLHSMKDLQDC